MFVANIHCIFLLSCIDQEFGNVKILNFKNENSVRMFCPSTCECFRAPIGQFGSEQITNSMVCSGTPDNDLLKLASPKYLNFPWNTVVLRNMIISDLKLNAESIVLENITVLEINEWTNSSFLTIHKQTRISSLPRSSTLAGLHIQDCDFLQNSLSLDDSLDHPYLQTLTIKHSKLESILCSSFFSNSPLKSIDLSYNSLVSVEPIYQQTRHSQLKELYLNNNHLTIIPDKLRDAFPALKILHLHQNPIKILDYDSLRNLFNLQEFILFSVENFVLQNAFYVDMKRWLPPALLKDEPIDADGLLNSLAYCAKYMCQNDRLYDWYSLRHNFCDEWKIHPQRIYAESTELSVQIKDSIQLSGQSFIFGPEQSQSPYSIDILDGEENTYRLVFKDFVSQSRNSLRNILFKIESQSLFSIVSLDLPLESVNSWIEDVFKERPSVLGFEALMFDASFSSVVVDISEFCRLEVPETIKKEFDEKIDAYERFVTASSNVLETSDFWKYFYIIQLDVRSLNMIDIFTYPGMMKQCFGKEIRMDALSIVNIDTTVPEFKDQFNILEGLIESFSKPLLLYIHRDSDRTVLSSISNNIIVIP